MDKFIVSARKYRPSTFETLIGQDSIATTLKNSIKRGQLAHAYLFCGPRGVGKTTTARIFAKIINCFNPSEEMEPCGKCESCQSFDQGRSYCIHELDAASNNSVDDIRALTEKVMIPPQVGKYSVYIIDEVHMLSTAAFNAFLKTLEEPPAHAIFILATTEKHKIIPTILSRCQVYDFNRISVTDIVGNLKYIAQKEGVIIDDNSLHIIAQKADGAMRDALTLFDQVVAFCGNNVNYDDVIKNLNVLDYDYYFTIVENSLCQKFGENLVIFDQVLSKGFNALYFIGGLSQHLRNLLVCKELSTSNLLEVSNDLKERYLQQSQKCSLQFLFKALSTCEKSEQEYQRSNNQRLLVEFMLVRLSQLQITKQSVSQTTTQPVTPSVSQPVNQPVNQPIIQPAIVQPSANPVKKEEATEQQTITQPREQSANQPVNQPANQPANQINTQPETQPEVTREEVAEQQTQQQAQQVVSIPGIKGINSILKETENKRRDDAENTKDALDFMGPSQNKHFTLEELKVVWLKFADEFEKKNPKLTRLVASLRQTEPLLESDNTSVIFKVGNSMQKSYIEDNISAKITAYLRRELGNNQINLVVKLKTPSEIAANLYLPKEKDSYMSQTNKAFQNLKEDLGAELLN